MTPTVTIDLHEYQQLVRLRDCLNQKELYFVYKNTYGMDIYVYVKDEAANRIASDMALLVEDRDRWRNLYLNNDNAKKETKKWYQFWK